MLKNIYMRFILASKSQFIFIFARIMTTILSFCFYFYHKYRYLL